MWVTSFTEHFYAIRRVFGRRVVQDRDRICVPLYGGVERYLRRK